MPGIPKTENARNLGVELSQVDSCRPIVRYHPIRTLRTSLPQQDAGAGRIADHEVVDCGSPIGTTHEQSCSIINGGCGTVCTVSMQFDVIEDGRGADHVGLEADSGIILNQRIGDSDTTSVDLKGRVCKTWCLSARASGPSHF